MSDQAWSPLEIKPDDYGVGTGVAGLVELIENKIDLRQVLTDNRVIVFEDFKVPREELDRAFDLMLPDRLAYMHGNTPRTQMGGNIYTSTEYPPDQPITLHNELSYAQAWPERLAFYCHIASPVGGATPVASSAAWLNAVRPEVREAFAGGVTYIQNLHDGYGPGKSWMATFETDDKAKVESFLAEGSSEWEWNDNGLRITQTRPSFTTHPVTGELGWFNQSDQWHPAGLPEDIREDMLELVDEDELPQYVTFANGDKIPDDYIQNVVDAGWSVAWDRQWGEGDLMLVDNVAAAHARRSYEGNRAILVAMCGPIA